MSKRELYATVMSFTGGDLADDLLSGNTSIEDVYDTKEAAQDHAKEANKAIKPNAEYRIIKLTIEPE